MEADAERAGKESFERDDDGVIWRPKYELVRTHTARRSLATNLYQKNVDYSDIKLITGHTTDKLVETYIKTTKRQAAVNLGRRLAQIAQ